MNKKILSIASLTVVFALTFFYLNQNFLAANDKDGKTCTNKSACNDKNKDIKAGGEFESYEFITNQACCDEMKNALQTDLLTIAGIKEVKFSSTCSVSKMTNVTVYYSAGETNTDNIAAYVKDKSYDCSGNGCTKDKECTPNKETKNKETKNL